MQGNSTLFQLVSPLSWSDRLSFIVILETIFDVEFTLRRLVGIDSVPTYNIHKVCHMGRFVVFI